ncbi:hypothetical protein AHIS1_p087 [Acaryochloris phage A-HIS1]|nr:hypothetical protein AHIS1_p087 [Acaryochloris phage A-HIS1]
MIYVDPLFYIGTSAKDIFFGTTKESESAERLRETSEKTGIPTENLKLFVKNIGTGTFREVSR